MLTETQKKEIYDQFDKLAKQQADIFIKAYSSYMNDDSMLDYNDDERFQIVQAALDVAYQAAISATKDIGDRLSDVKFTKQQMENIINGK